MSDVTMDVFYPAPEHPSYARFTALVEAAKADYGDRIETVAHTGQDDAFKEYNITTAPAVVIDGMMKIMGFCPDRDILVKALTEVGLE